MSDKVRSLRAEIGRENYNLVCKHQMCDSDFRNVILDTYGKIAQYNNVKDLINQRYANFVPALSEKLVNRIHMFVDGSLARNNRTVASYLLCNYIVNDLFEHVRELFLTDNMM